MIRIKVSLQKIVYKLSEIWSGLFIPDPDLDFLPIPDSRIQGSKMHRIPDPRNTAMRSIYST